MNKRDFLLSILRKIENLQNGIFTYAYETKVWWEISVSDYNFYTSSEFRKFTKVWHKLANKKGIKILFVCGWIPTEETLMKLANEDNLIINI